MFAIVAASFVICLIAATPVQAETRVQEGIHGTEVWTRQASPYVVEGYVIFQPGSTLTIEAGASVVGDPGADSPPGIFLNQATLVSHGSTDTRVSMDGLGGITFYKGTADIEYTDMHGSGLTFQYTYGRVSSSTISGAGTAIYSQESPVTITSSSLSGNDTGIYVDTWQQPVISIRDTSADIGGLGNIYDDAGAPTLNIAGSVIVNNTRYSIRNISTTTVQAENNWWGDTEGPSGNGSNRISGFVDYEPWLMEDPTKVKQGRSCCSSVIFIPGLEASELYTPGGLFSSSTNMRWVPNRRADVLSLYMDAYGSSTDTSVYAGGPIGSAFGLVDIYKSFMRSLDALQASGSITEWKPFGYDWRKSVMGVATGAEQRATSSESLIDEVEHLAARSKTGKVSIVAHSNGGLVAKALIAALEERGKAAIVDTLISVAVPYLGTPQAIAALLHGEGQSILGGLIASRSVMRGLGANMASAYSLLPSREYFSQGFGPTIAFASTSIVRVNAAGAYPLVIADKDHQDAFIADSAGIRLGMNTGDPNIPLRGNTALLAAANTTHTVLDGFSWPKDLVRWAIVGWNVATTKAIEYTQDILCRGGGPGVSSCAPFLSMQASTTLMGDGTVVVPSAAYGAGSVVSVDLAAASRQDGKNYEHKDILESSSVRSVITSILGSSASMSTTTQAIASMPAITVSDATSRGEPSYLVLATHSPVELHVYDALGRHVGPKPLPPELAGSDLYIGATEATIPGSRISVEGTNDDPEYRVYLPDVSGEKYSVVLDGTGFGEFSYDASRVKAGTYVDTVQFVGMPVTPLTVATTSIFGGARMSSTSAALLRIDIDGDGLSDVSATSSSQFDYVAYLAGMKKAVKLLLGQTTKARTLVNRIEALERLAKKGNIEVLRSRSKILARRVAHMHPKKVSASDRSYIGDMIDTLVAQLER